MSHPNVHSVDLGELDRDALPVLKEYSGSLEHLRALIDRDQDGAANVNANANLPWVAQEQHAPSSSPLSRTLQSVRLLEPMQLREFTPLTISRVLMDLPALTSLKITFALHSGYDSNGVFRTIISSCPQLLHLDLTCTSKPSFYLVRHVHLKVAVQSVDLVQGLLFTLSQQARQASDPAAQHREVPR